MIIAFFCFICYNYSGKRAGKKSRNDEAQCHLGCWRRQISCHKEHTIKVKRVKQMIGLKNNTYSQAPNNKTRQIDDGNHSGKNFTTLWWIFTGWSSRVFLWQEMIFLIFLKYIITFIINSINPEVGWCSSTLRQLQMFPSTL